MTPRLEEVTPANFDAAIGIRIHPDQEHAVQPVVRSLAEAYVHPAGVAWPRLIVDEDRPVGFLMAFLDIDWYGDGSVRRSGLWRRTSPRTRRAGATAASPSTRWPT